VTEERVVGKLGKLAPARPQGLHMLAFYQPSPLPKAPDRVDPPQAEWGMLGNDRYGDCTFAGIAHARMAGATTLSLSETLPTEQEVIDAYLAYTNGQDTGAVEADLLKYWQNNKIFGSILAAFAPTDHADFDELRSVIAAYGLVYIGVQLPNTYQNQFINNEPWDLTGTPADNQIEGGHCIILVGYDVDYAYAVTWGKIQKITWRWLQSYMEESWALITPEIVLAGHSGSLRLEELMTDIGRL